MLFFLAHMLLAQAHHDHDNHHDHCGHHDRDNFLRHHHQPKCTGHHPTKNVDGPESYLCSMALDKHACCTVYWEPMDDVVDKTTTADVYITCNFAKLTSAGYCAFGVYTGRGKESHSSHMHDLDMTKYDGTTYRNIKTTGKGRWSYDDDVQFFDGSFYFDGDAHRCEGSFKVNSTATFDLENTRVVYSMSKNSVYHHDSKGGDLINLKYRAMEGYDAIFHLSSADWSRYLSYALYVSFALFVGTFLLRLCLLARRVKRTQG
eukprot:GEMP01043275.1.p1 GENE.GEMP01043275.1~~GEMP01043275.1.p1  ORF type:complete len:261 (+),score=29.78 GEMP01043275.1:96-878(+)